MRHYRTILAYARSSRWYWLAAFASMMAGTIFTMLQPWPVQALIDRVLLGQGGAGPRWAAWPVSSGAGIIGGLCLAQLLLTCAGMGCENLTILLSTKAGRLASNSLASELFARLQRRSLIDHARHSVGDNLTRVVVDSWCAARCVEQLIMRPAAAMIGIGVLVIIMSRLNVRMTVTAVAAAPLMSASAILFGSSIRRAARERREVESRLHAHVQQTLSGMLVVQAFAQEMAETARFRKFADAAISAQRENILRSQLSETGTGLVAAAAHAAVLWIGARQVLVHQLTVGELLVFIAYLRALKSHFLALARSYAGLQGLAGQIGRVEQVLLADRALRESRQPRSMHTIQGRVTLDGVTFGYELGRPVLHEVSLEALPGQCVALVGPSGAGKSTLVHLILRLFDPWSGRVLLDGIDVRELRVRELRQQIAVVLQEPYLLPVSIAANIAFGRPHANRRQIEEAARAAQLHEFVAALPHGYDTIVGERGAKLSGGERQRIAIARAFLRDAPLLILDEPTSALDPDTEGRLVESLKRLRRGRTAFIIAHRLSTIADADLALVIQNGRVVEAGRHQDLIQSDSAYAGLHAWQPGAVLPGIAATKEVCG
jgi:ATP-binding cassette subfamily B protein/subfamily B ATP-binding cassette protein MsbA